MPVLIILAIAGLLIVLQRAVYRKHWSDHLTARASFSDSYLFEGAQTGILEEMGNGKLLPLPWVHLKFQILRNGRTDNLFKSDIFNILFHQKIERRSEMRFEKRGFYEISSLDLVSYDLFITTKFAKAVPNHAAIVVYPQSRMPKELKIPFEKLMGEVTTRRYTLEDPFLFKGIREYQETDSFHHINFASSARNGKWMVNVHEYTLEQRIAVVLLTDLGSAFFNETEYEMGLRYAAALITGLEKEGIPCAFLSNGVDAIDGTEPLLPSGCSENHTHAALELMARLDLQKTGEKGTDLLESFAEDPDPNLSYVIISPCRSKELLTAFETLREKRGTGYFFSPIRSSEIHALSEKEKQREEKLPGFYYLKV